MLIPFEEAVEIPRLVHELAAYENQSDAVQATAKSLQKTIAFAPEHGKPNKASSAIEHLPSPNRPARCLLLHTSDGDLAGMAVYYYNYSTWTSKTGIFEEDLYGKLQHRRKGYGKRLLSELAQELSSMDGGRLEWNVLKWNKPSIEFYQAIGAQSMDKWVGMRVDGDSIAKLAHILDSVGASLANRGKTGEPLLEHST